MRKRSAQNEPKRQDKPKAQLENTGNTSDDSSEPESRSRKPKSQSEEIEDDCEPSKAPIENPKKKRHKYPPIETEPDVFVYEAFQLFAVPEPAGDGAADFSAREAFGETLEDVAGKVKPRVGQRKRTVAEVANALNARWPEKHTTRERVYDLVREAIRRGMILPTPPLEVEQMRRLKARFGLNGGPRTTIQVVNSVHNLPQEVAASAAMVVASLVKKHAGRQKDRPVHLGLPVGNSALRVTEVLGQILRSDPECPSFVVHALLPAGFARRTRQAPPSAMTAPLRNGLNQVRFIEMDAEPVVPCSEYDRARARLGWHRAFIERDDIDIIITSLACADHSHAVFSHYLETELPYDLHRETFDELREQRWVGDLLCQAYSNDCPITPQRGLRSVGLFEIPELVEMARRCDKDVVLVAGPCSFCGESRHPALHPLLRSPSLRIWNHLITDVRTVFELLDGPGPSAVSGFAPTRPR